MICVYFAPAVRTSNKSIRVLPWHNVPMAKIHGYYLQTHIRNLKIATHSSFALEPASVGERRRHQHESSNSMNKSAILSHKWRSKYIQVIDIRCLPACYTNVQVFCTLVAIRYRMEKFSFIFTTHFEIRREKNTTNKHWRWKDIERECVRILLLPYAAHTRWKYAFILKWRAAKKWETLRNTYTKFGKVYQILMHEYKNGKNMKIVNILTQ